MCVYNARVQDTRGAENSSPGPCVLCLLLLLASWYPQAMGWAVNQPYQPILPYAAHVASVDGSDIVVSAKTGLEKFVCPSQSFMQHRMHNACTIPTAYQRGKRKSMVSPSCFFHDVCENRNESEVGPVHRKEM